ncbi:MAG: hypothetical protein C5S49_03505 [Candidatus Methanogaster sp.]|nr:MAG: hypothetical protein C5S49_03505 [ANME-2 cluster archaeon]
MSPERATVVSPQCVAFHAATITVSPSVPFTTTEYPPLLGPVPVVPAMQSPLVVSVTLKLVPMGTCVTPSDIYTVPAIPYGVGIACVHTGRITITMAIASITFVILLFIYIPHFILFVKTRKSCGNR